MNGWIGVDLDGTLARFDRFRGVEHIGDPLRPMVERVKQWLRDGRDVRILTARVSALFLPDVTIDDWNDAVSAREAIRLWCVMHFGQELPITAVKDYGLIEMWDDRAVQVVRNLGAPIGPRELRELA